MIFSGRQQPPTLYQNDKEVIIIVEENENAIGYISTGSITDAVKSIQNIKLKK